MHLTWFNLESITLIHFNISVIMSFWIADAINNAAGFGFNGYDSDGLPRWDLISNLRIMNIEVSQATIHFLKLCQNESDF